MKQVWVVVLFLLPVVYAANSIDTAHTTIDFRESTAIIKSNIVLNLEEEVGNLTLILTPDSKDLNIIINDEKKECLLQAEFARCGTITNGTHTVNISYETSYPIAKVGENTLFRYTDKLPYPAAKQLIILKLPVGYIIPREKGKDESFYISPTTEDVYSDGQRVILQWEQEGQELPLSVVTRKVIGAPVGWIAATGTSLLLAGLVTIWATLRGRKKPKPKTVRKKKEVVPQLIDNEQKIVNFLKENGEVWQKQIQHSTGFSKAKVSRIIRNLEERGVIKKTIYGNTNKINLKK